MSDEKKKEFGNVKMKWPRIVVWANRVIGWCLIAVFIVAVPPVSNIVGLNANFSILYYISFALVGAAWLALSEIVRLLIAIEENTRGQG